jgi:hypothetical protein
MLCRILQIAVRLCRLPASDSVLIGMSAARAALYFAYGAGLIPYRLLCKALGDTSAPILAIPLCASILDATFGLVWAWHCASNFSISFVVFFRACRGTCGF